MMDAMTVEEKVRAAQHGRVFPSQAAKRIAFLNANPRSGRVIRSRDRSWL